MWHTNIAMADPGETVGTVFPTRAHFTGDGVLHELADFTDAQHLQAVAAHELGHFLVQWRQGSWMHRIFVQEAPGNIIPKGEVSFSHPDGDRSRPVLIGGAAGERACDKWLHDQGLWTPARAVYGEIQGRTDREAAQQKDPSITFDGGPNDYRHFQDEADKILDDVWPLLLRGLKRFSSYAELSGDAMCALLGIANNPAVA